MIKATFSVGVADPRDCEATFHALSAAATQTERTDGFAKAGAVVLIKANAKCTKTVDSFLDNATKRVQLMSQQTPIDSIGLNRDSSSALYERVGGKSAVAAVVNLLYDRITNDPLLLPFFDGIDVRRQKSKQVAFLTTVFGGPTRYSGEDLRQAHSHLVARGLNDKHFNAVAGHLQSTLEELAVPTTLIDEIVAIVESTRNDVLNR